ncbi:MAG: DoxX protein [Alphaproteobacteria bacterium]
MSDESRLRLGLFAMRIGVVLLFLPWIAAKFLSPEAIQHVFAEFYFVDQLPVSVSYLLGGIQAVLVLGFLLGVFKFWTYGGVLVMHAVSTFSTWEKLLAPGEDHNILFWAAVPALAAILALFLVRDKDTFLTLKFGGGR